jgi:hypothetical protein
MTQAKDSGLHTDALLARYHAAQAELDAHGDVVADGVVRQTAPSALVRANILTHAQQVATAVVPAPTTLNATILGAFHAYSKWSTGQFDDKKSATNDSQWKIRALASVAVLGLAGLLFMQWDRGTPDEKEVAFNMERTAPAAKSPVPAPLPAPSAPSPAAHSAAVVDAPVVTAARVAPAPSVAETAAPPSKPAPTRRQAPASPPTTAPIAQPNEATTAAAALPPALPSPAPAPVATAPAARAVAPAAAPLAAARAAGAAKSLDSAANVPQAASAESAPARLMSPNAALFSAIREADAASLQLALSRGADKNAKSNGTPAISLCVQSNQPALVRQLAAAGADLNAPDAQGKAPLAHAQAKGLDEMIKILLELGAK